MTDSRVSIILPFHNRVDCLSRAVNSVLAQTYADFDLILVDDGSSDGSSRLAEAFESEVVSIVSLPQRRGAAEARNSGLEAAEGGMVAFMDSDDYWEPSKLDRQVTYLRECQSSDPSAIGVGCAWRVDGSPQPSKVFLPGPYSRPDLVRRRIPGVGTPHLLLEATIAKSGRFDSTFSANLEFDFLMSILTSGRSLYVLDEVLTVVSRGRGDHIASGSRSARAYRQALSKYYDEIGLEPELESWYRFRAARGFLAARMLREARVDLRGAMQHDGLRRGLVLAAGIAIGSRGVLAAEAVLGRSEAGDSTTQTRWP